MVNPLNISNQEHRRVITSLQGYIDGTKKDFISTNTIANLDTRRIVDGIAEAKKTGSSTPSTDKIYDPETRRVLDSMISHINRSR